MTSKAGPSPSAQSSDWSAVTRAWCTPRLGRRCHRVARERLGQRAEYGHEPAPTRVHDARAPQDRELSRSRVERGTGTVVRGAGHVTAVSGVSVGCVGSGGGHRQDRALHGVRDRLPGGLGGSAQCVPQAVTVGILAVIRLTAACRPRGPGPCREGAARGLFRSFRGLLSRLREPSRGRRRAARAVRVRGP